MPCPHQMVDRDNIRGRSIRSYYPPNMGLVIFAGTYRPKHWPVSGVGLTASNRRAKFAVEKVCLPSPLFCLPNCRLATEAKTTENAVTEEQERCSGMLGANVPTFATPIVQSPKPADRPLAHLIFFSFSIFPPFNASGPHRTRTVVYLPPQQLSTAPHPWWAGPRARVQHHAESRAAHRRPSCPARLLSTRPGGKPASP